MPDIHRFCTFTLAGHCLGIEVERVQEVLRLQEITPVPLAPGVVHGLINLRGRIVSRQRSADLQCGHLRRVNDRPARTGGCDRDEQ